MKLFVTTAHMEIEQKSEWDKNCVSNYFITRKKIKQEDIQQTSTELYVYLFLRLDCLF